MNCRKIDEFIEKRITYYRNHKQEAYQNLEKVHKSKVRCIPSNVSK